MKTESYKILEERRKTLQQMYDAGVGKTFDEGELFRAELKNRTSNLEAALNFISSNPLVSGMLPLSFVKWYSGMDEDKILKAVERWKNESGNCGY